MSNTPYSPEAMRARFHAASDELEAVRAKAQPVRDEYERVRNKVMEIEQKELAPLKAKLKEVEGPAYDLQNEIASLARALNMKTGERPAVAAAVKAQAEAAAV